ncbi:MAG: hypothetical protein C0433_05935 [Cyclobacterium sp.]|nr:hypothetical protein [Cyclobacterium sp.]
MGIDLLFQTMILPQLRIIPSFLIHELKTIAVDLSLLAGRCLLSWMLPASCYFQKKMTRSGEMAILRSGS